MLNQSAARVGISTNIPQLDQFHSPLPQNTLIFHLTDGVYTPFNSLVLLQPPPSVSLARSSSSRILPTSSFDALLRLSKLDDSIQDALVTRNKLSADLETLLFASKRALDDKDHLVAAEDRLKTIEYAVRTVDKQLARTRKQQEEKRASLAARQRFMRDDLSVRELQSEKMHHALPELPPLRDEHDLRNKALASQRRRICEDLQKCYPNSPIPKQPLAFKIRDLPLPNSDDLDSQLPETVAAALGYVAHVISLLSSYLREPLVYPVGVKGSTSTIVDTISLLPTSASTTERYKDEVSLRTYPLFSAGVPRFRFEYGVFLLNKDIQLLLETAYGVRVLDVRQTLPNLKYLLYVATAGEGELPARKAGGVRGLARDKGNRDDAAGLERPGSGQSDHGALSEMLRQKGGAVGLNGDGKGAVESLRRNMGATVGGARKGS